MQGITLVELTGQRSNEFEEDMSSAIKHLDVIENELSSLVQHISQNNKSIGPHHGL
jgi:hypothetical protein